VRRPGDLVSGRALWPSNLQDFPIRPSGFTVLGRRRAALNQVQSE
jgi:hypothetical protein